jgi:hypothetical protein
LPGSKIPVLLTKAFVDIITKAFPYVSVFSDRAITNLDEAEESENEA